MEEKLISILVPVYNVEQYVDSCIKSIVEQTYTNLEIILVDDGSTDRSGMICDEWCEIDQRIKCVHKKNEGLVSARKAGLEIATGEYIGFVDSDDYVDQGFCSYMLEVARDNNVDIVHTGYVREKGKDSTNSREKYSEGIIDLSDYQNKIELIRKYILDRDDEHRMTWGIVSKFFKRSIIKDSYKKVPDNQSYGEDFLCFLEAIFCSRTIYLSKETKYHYIIRDASIVHHKDKVGNLINISSLYKEIRRCLIDKDAFNELRESWENAYVKALISALEGIAPNLIVPRYFLSEEKLKMIKGKKAILYGMGNVGTAVYHQISQICTEVICADKYADNTEIISFQDVLNIEFDVLLVAILDENKALAIKNEFMELGVEENKIIWSAPLIRW